MRNNYLKSYAKINLALNVTGKRNSMHKIESIVSFVDLHDLISIIKINSNNHQISFYGKFSKNIKRQAGSSLKRSSSSVSQTRQPSHLKSKLKGQMASLLMMLMVISIELRKAERQ